MQKVELKKETVIKKPYGMGTIVQVIGLLGLLFLLINWIGGFVAVPIVFKILAFSLYGVGTYMSSSLSFVSTKEMDRHAN
jgi:hypothetical protein